MTVLHIPATASTPEVLLDAQNNRVEMRGICNPLRPEALFVPLATVLKHHFSNRQPGLFTAFFDLEYISSGSARALRALLTDLDAEGRVGRWIVLIWASGNDEGQRELGLALTEGLSNLDLVTNPTAFQ